MKSFLIFFLIIIFFISCEKQKNINFVSIKDGHFRLHDAPFYPVALNYGVWMEANQKELWACPDFCYSDDPNSAYLPKDSCILKLKAEMELIREMGFNTVRIVGIGEEEVEDKKTGELSVRARVGFHRDTTIMLFGKTSYTKYCEALAGLFKVINEAGLKAILLIRSSPETQTTEEHFKKLGAYFKNDSTILAYDFFNEPLYFDSIERTKEDVAAISRHWKKMARKYAPNQLLTIGLEGIREVFKWDPNILDVDFLSLHPYEYEPEQVRNEIYWYGKYISVPWILGETGLAADDSVVSYNEQRMFAKKTVKQVVNCGGVGYSWWQYMDIDLAEFQKNYLGVLSRSGETKTLNGYIVKGAVKPVVNEFKSFRPEPVKDSCICLSNYYNYSQHKKFRLKGYLMDENNKPIEGGVILGWNQWWSSSFHTVSKQDGSFELLGSFPFYHWMASATRYSMVRAEILPDTAKVIQDKIPTVNLGRLKVQKL